MRRYLQRSVQSAELRSAAASAPQNTSDSESSYTSLVSQYTHDDAEQHASTSTTYQDIALKLTSSCESGSHEDELATRTRRRRRRHRLHRSSVGDDIASASRCRNQYSTCVVKVHGYTLSDEEESTSETTEEDNSIKTPIGLIERNERTEDDVIKTISIGAIVKNETDGEDHSYEESIDLIEQADLDLGANVSSKSDSQVSGITVKPDYAAMMQRVCRFAERCVSSAADDQHSYHQNTVCENPTLTP